LTPLLSDVAERLDAVESRLARALAHSRRQRSAITLVAVSKKFSASAVRIAYEAGLRDFGENYVQEFAAKQPALADLTGARFHFIGHLQSNKARLGATLFQVIHAVDSAKLIERLDSAALELGKHLDLLIEVKLSEEESKNGAEPSAIPQLLEAATRCGNVSVIGLMTMPPWSADPERSRPYFQRLAALARAHHLTHLSMGMSNDFEVAIEEGATIIRVGTALFGPRPKPA
jgi:pyridoxal phosphate enzyme (YggS family)